VNFGVVVLLIVSGWALLSIVLSLAFGASAKARDSHTGLQSPLPTSGTNWDVATSRSVQDTPARRSA
jgi:hypothetical protein